MPTPSGQVGTASPALSLQSWWDCTTGIEPGRQRGFQLKSPTRKSTRNNFSILQIKSEFLSSLFVCHVLMNAALSWQAVAIPNLYNKICCLLGQEVFL